MSTTNFKVDTSLTALLGENYRSTEAALKELIDNAWDADSSSIKISMPEPFEKSEIIIEDNGSGMTNKEIRNEYLFIARSRTSRKGEFTPLLKRKVKGKKGIGKFAGLHVAGEMILISKARGKETTLTIKRDELLKWKDDLEKLDLPITTDKCGEEESGTTIILRNLNQNLHFPNPLKLSQLLIIEYSRENNFEIEINGKPLDILDLKGNSKSGELKTKNAGTVKFTYTISDDKKNLKHSGISLRVGGKIIGKPSYFGLEDDEEIPKKLLKKIYAEVEVDGLVDDVTADWGAKNNSDLYIRVTATCTNGQTATRILRVLNVDNDNCNPCGVIGEDDQLKKSNDLNDFTVTSEEKIVNLSIFPNPTSDKIRIQYINNIEGMVEISIYNIKGEKIESFNEVLRRGAYSNVFNVSDYTSGVYIAEIKGEKYIERQKIIVE